MKKTIYWKPPVDARDLPLLEELTISSECIVSCIPEFCSGCWVDFLDDHIQFGTEFFAHIDSNFLARLMEFSVDKPKNDLERRTAAVMCMAICANMKVNPTFATNEYAFTGTREPDDRLAYFYFLDNSHPQVLADLALGRIQHVPQRDLKRTAHFGKLDKRTKFFGLVNLPLLKLMEIQTNRGANDCKNVEKGQENIKELMLWMFDSFLLVGPVIMLAHELWGRRSIKSMVSSPNSVDPIKILNSVDNATWDLVLALNWAEWENKRDPKNGDPVNLIFTHDRALARIAHSMMGEPGTHDLDSQYMSELEQMWPLEIANDLFQLHRRLEATTDDKTRKYMSAVNKTKYYEQQKKMLIEKIKSNCCKL